MLLPRVYICSTYTFHHIFTFRIEPNMKSFSHANGTRCAVTVPSFDFVKGDCAVGSAVLVKRGL